jgi:hypothetical protein
LTAPILKKLVGPLPPDHRTFSLFFAPEAALCKNRRPTGKNSPPFARRGRAAPPCIRAIHAAGAFENTTRAAPPRRPALSNIYSGKSERPRKNLRRAGLRFAYAQLDFEYAPTRFGCARNDFGHARSRFDHAQNEFGHARNNFEYVQIDSGLAPVDFGYAQNDFGYARGRFWSVRGHFGCAGVDLIAVVDGFGASLRYFPNFNLNAAFVIVEV